MKNQVIKTPTKGKEYFGFTDADIVVSSKKHPDINSLIGSKDKSGLLETVSHITMDNVRGMQYNEKNSSLAIKHQKASKEKTFKITFGDAETRNSIAEGIGSAKGLNRNFTAEGKMKPLLANLFFIAIGVLVTAALAGIAHEAATGGEVQEFTGRRSGIKNLMASIATALGPIGVGVIGGLIVLALIWNAIKRWQNPANDILYS